MLSILVRPWILEARSIKYLAHWHRHPKTLIAWFWLSCDKSAGESGLCVFKPSSGAHLQRLCCMLFFAVSGNGIPRLAPVGSFLPPPAFSKATPFSLQMTAHASCFNCTWFANTMRLIGAPCALYLF